MIKTMPPVKEIIDLMQAPTEADRALVERAYAFAHKAHEGQTRYSGDPYFIHVVGAAMNVAALGMDAPMIAAGLLHDILEDAGIEASVLKKEFGADITGLVEGVTKLGKYKYQGLERHAESLRKLLIAASKDVRVLIVKLADRLNNMQTLEHVPEHKRGRIAIETLDIYAPLAGRLGINKIKNELEDLAFPYAYPKEYKETLALLDQKRVRFKKYIEKAHRHLQKALVKNGITDFTSFYRVKGMYSLYKKLQKHDDDIDEITDLYALRVIVPAIPDCYKVFGIVHGMWKPLAERIKDYIAIPKPNGYQSLHTTVLTGDGGVVEIQIRTTDMHEEAQFGIAAHFAYKEGVRRGKGDAIKKKLLWMNDLVDWQKGVSESGEFLESLKMDFFKDRIFILTPKGDVVDLPEGSTPIDFAYAIHSGIGDHIFGAKINDKFCGIDALLHDGDRVEIITKESSSPKVKWLQGAKTTLARRHIRSYLQKKKEKEGGEE